MKRRERSLRLLDIDRSILVTHLVRCRFDPCVFAQDRSNRIVRNGSQHDSVTLVNEQQATYLPFVTDV